MWFLLSKSNVAAIMNTAALRVAGGSWRRCHIPQGEGRKNTGQVARYCSIERLTSIHAYGQVKKNVQMNPVCMLGAQYPERSSAGTGGTCRGRAERPELEWKPSPLDSAPAAMLPDMLTMVTLHSNSVALKYLDRAVMCSTWQEGRQTATAGFVQ